jgi:hypothetical protein
MKLLNPVMIWWNGIPPSVTEREDGSFQLRYQNPNHPPARVRFYAAAKRVRFLKQTVATIIGGVAVAVIIKWLGLS